MKIVEPSFKIMRGLERDVLPFLEECGRTCYKSEDLITETSASKFVSGIVKSKHESVIEHASITVRFVGSRSMTHQLVRHRLAAYSQESQRFVNYSKDKHGSELTFIDPMFYINDIQYNHQTFIKILEDSGDNDIEEKWLNVVKAYCEFEESCIDTERKYMEMVEELGVKAEDAREILPNASKTEIVMTANLRVWRHIFKERALNKHAQFQIRYLAQGVLKEFNQVLPEIFSDQAKVLDDKGEWIV